MARKTHSHSERPAAPAADVPAPLSSPAPADDDVEIVIEPEVAAELSSAVQLPAEAEPTPAEPAEPAEPAPDDDVVDAAEELLPKAERAARRAERAARRAERAEVRHSFRATRAAEAAATEAVAAEPAAEPVGEVGPTEWPATATATVTLSDGLVGLSDEAVASFDTSDVVAPEGDLVEELSFLDRKCEAHGRHLADCACKGAARAPLHKKPS